MERALLVDRFGYRVQCFTPSSGLTLPTVYVPTENTVIKLDADVAITLNGVGVDYLAGDIVGFAKHTTYTLSAATPAHGM